VRRGPSDCDFRFFFPFFSAPKDNHRVRSRKFGNLEACGGFRVAIPFADCSRIRSLGWRADSGFHSLVSGCAVIRGGTCKIGVWWPEMR
jgi:hypothetical protein